MATTRRLRAVLEGKDQGATALLSKLKGGLAALGVTALAVGAIAIGKKLVGSIINAAQVSGKYEAAVTRLNVALANQGEFTSESSRGLRDFAQRLTDVSLATETQILSSVAQAKAYGASNKAARELTAAATDLAAATGVDMETAFRQVNRTLGGFAGELGETIPELKALTAAELQAGGAAEVIAKKMGGAGAAIAKTLPGAINNVNSAIEQLTRAVGGPFGEVFKEFLNTVAIPFIKSLRDTINETKIFRVFILSSAEGVARFAASVVRVLAPLGNMLKLFVLFKISKFVADLKLVTDILDSLVPLTNENRNAFDDLADTLARLALEAPKVGAEVTNVVDALDKVDPTGIKATDAAIKKLGAETLPVAADRIADATRLVELLTLRLDTARGAFERAFLLRQLEELNAKIRGEFIPGMVDAGEAVRFAIENSVGALQTMLVRTNQQVVALGATIRKSLREAGVRSALALGDALVDAAFDGDVAFGAFFKSLLQDIAKAIVQALILKAILGAIGFDRGGGVASFFSGVGATGGQAGLRIPGSDVGRDRVPAILRPGELVFPRELSDFILANVGTGGTPGRQIIELRSDIPLVAERLNEGVRQGSVRVVATRLATPRGVR